MQNKKVFAIGDFHYPTHIRLKPVLDFLKWWKPDILIFGGDIWELDYLSHWNSDNFKNIGFTTINSNLGRESGEIRNMLSLFVKTSSAKQTYFIEGNHERWIQQYIEKYPQVYDLSVKTLLRLKGLGIKFVPMEGNVPVGKLVFVHGQQYSQENPAKQAFIRSHRNVVMFHHHKHIEWPGFSDLDSSDKTRVVCVPCFCNRAPLYLRGRANAWSNGFFTAIVKPKTGHFTSWVTEVSPKGNFLIQDGREFV